MDRHGIFSHEPQRVAYKIASLKKSRNGIFLLPLGQEFLFQLFLISFFFFILTSFCNQNPIVNFCEKLKLSSEYQTSGLLVLARSSSCRVFWDCRVHQITTENAGGFHHKMSSLLYDRLVLGYAYPAFECYKTVERNRVEKEELRFWCQYWILIAILTVVERIGDTFISWLPMYSEMKLAFILYLWYPKTKGTGYVYGAMLRPYVGTHETDIERKLGEWRLRLWDLAIFYWRNCTDLGQSAFFTVLEYLAGQPARFTNSSKKKKGQDGLGAPPDPPTVASAFRRHMGIRQGDRH